MLSKYLKGEKMTKQNYTIHGLRGLLAITVVIYHVYRGLVSDGYLNELKTAMWIESTGSVAVNLFFIISGYLIIRSLIKHQNVKGFFINRFLRIYPVFLLIHLFIFIVGPIINYKWMSNISGEEYFLHFVSNILLLPGIFPILPAAQIVSWSISYEVLFYFLVGCIFYTIRDLKSKSNRLIFVFSLILSLVFGYYHIRALFFVVGILIYFLINIIKEKFTYKNIYYLNGIILLSCLTLFYKSTPLIVSLLLSFLFFVTIINQKGLLSKILRTKLFIYLGNISYSLYLWHTFAFFPVKNFLIPKISVYIDSPIILFFIFLLTGVSISIIVSHYSYEIIEKKLTKIIKRKIVKSNMQVKSKVV